MTAHDEAGPTGLPPCSYCGADDWTEIHARRRVCQCGAVAVRYATVDPWEQVSPRTVRRARAAQDAVRDPFDDATGGDS